MRSAWTVALALCVGLLVVAASASETHKKTVGVEVRLRLIGAVPDKGIEAEFYARSEPGSPVYRKHLSVKQLTALFGAPKASVTAAVEWMKAHGAFAVSVVATQDYVIGFFPNTLTAQRAFTTSMVDKKGKPLSELPVPKELAAHVRAVHVPRAFPLAKKINDRKAPSYPGERQTQDPPAIRNRYELPSENKYSQNPSLSSYSHAVAEFQGENFLMSDIQMFNSQYGAPAPIIDVVGPNNYLPNEHAEGSLDLEYLNTLAPNVTTYWVAKSTFDIVGACQLLMTISPPPSVFSISYGAKEADFTTEFMTSTSAEFMKLGLAGVSVLVASGDDGDCARSSTSPNPSFPATSPYATTVGATYAHDSAGDEIGWSNSGGGLSTVFDRPQYQNATVNRYLANTTDLPPPGWFAPNGRAIPDVSALGSHFNIAVLGAWELVDGTSCAAPTFAAVISLINMERMAAGKSALGFLNPTLYKMGSVGFDVERGDNQNICMVGFPARKGWDAVTGLGTPRYDFLRSKLA